MTQDLDTHDIRNKVVTHVAETSILAEGLYIAGLFYYRFYLRELKNVSN